MNRINNYIKERTKMKHIGAILFFGVAMFWCGVQHGKAQVVVATAKAVLEKQIEDAKKESSEEE